MHTSTRRRAGAFLVLAIIVFASLPPVAAASADSATHAADPITDKREEAERIARQLEQQSRRVSILAEDYDEARVRIAAVEEELAAASTSLARTDRHAADIRRRLKTQAVEAYVQGGSGKALAMLAGAKRVEDLAIRTEYVKTVTSSATDVLDELRSVRLDLERQRGRLDAVKAEATSTAELAESKRKEAAVAEGEQRATLQKVQGELGELVAAETKRRAEAEAKRVQAELAAKKEREEAAARATAAARARATTTTVTRSAGPVVTPKPTTTIKPTTTTAPGGDQSASPPPPSAGAEAAVEEAKRQLGKPYEYGASGPGSFDCSGLTSWSWRAGGKSLPHSSRAQWTATSRVAIDDLVPGDILFYGEPIHHVGLFVGNGQMIEASETGTPVRYASIYRRDLVGAGRVN